MAIFNAINARFQVPKGRNFIKCDFAGHAEAEGLILVTNNEREFRRIRGLEIENWAV